MATTQPPRVFGVDFGAQRCVVAESTGDVVLNELGAMTTATLVSFKGEERLLPVRARGQAPTGGRAAAARASARTPSHLRGERGWLCGGRGGLRQGWQQDAVHGGAAHGHVIRQPGHADEEALPR
ncbi:hypothetical protein ON010_g9899 [Phytophthora cinnamomi]|nr:hypothetical protein ON010_g9899 [Phytophthora cinnamomi]